MGVELEGFDKLIKTLEGLAGRDAAEDAMMDGLTKAGKMIQKTAKSNCPVASGQLRDNIELLKTESAVFVGTNVEYAPYVEYGTGRRGDPSVSHRQDWAGMPPQPFLYPALQTHIPTIKTKVEEALREAIRKAGG